MSLFGLAHFFDFVAQVFSCLLVGSMYHQKQAKNILT